MTGKGLILHEQVTMPVLAFTKAWEVSRVDEVKIETDDYLEAKHSSFSFVDQNMDRMVVKLVDIPRELTDDGVVYTIGVPMGAVALEMSYSISENSESDRGE